MADSLVYLLKESAARFAEREALVLGSERVTYAELWRRVSAITGFFRAHGLNRGDRVALLIENSVDYVAAYYAVLAAGGVAVALNTAARERDLQNWITHSGASWLIGQANHPAWSALQNMIGAIRVVQIGGVSASNAIIWDEMLAHAPNAPVLVEAHAPAAIIYTSGTTGQPKGVALSHKSLVANTRSILGYLPITHATRTLNVLPFYYSYGNSVLHTHLAAGACLVLENSLTYPHKVVERMAQEKVTGFNGVPSTYALLLSRVKFEDYDLSALRYVTQAGGAMAPATAKRVGERLPGAAIYIMYGQTEATARLSYLPPDKLEEKTGSVGIPIPGVSLQIRNETGHPLPAGEAGEIWAKGDNVMLGYWRDEATTAAVLRDGWLKTGDLGYMDNDGYVFIKGRRSDMIKTGAHRINPSEIEEAISEVDGVAEVAVVGVDDEILGQVVKAVVVRNPGHTVDEKAIKAHCRDRLAIYKIPKFIEFATQLPKTASGKVKRFELAANHKEHRLG